MCGRFVLYSKLNALVRRMGVDLVAQGVPGPEARYNITPGGPVAVVLEDRDTLARRLDYFSWGLVPSWAEDPSIAFKMINARSETALQKASFRHAMKYRRCLLPADGWYEWKREGGHKQPWYFSRKDGEPFALAGLWEHKQYANGSEILSCSILTTRANELMEPVHHRMPVIIEPQDYDRWLDSRQENPRAVTGLLRPPVPEPFHRYPVSTLVNSSLSEGPDLIAAVDVEASPRQTKLFE